MHHGTWIEITRSWIDAAIVRKARIVRCHRFWRAEESASLDALATDIRAALAPLGPRPGRVRVLWSAPGVAVDLCAAPLPGPAGIRAVRLAHAAAAGLTPGLDPIGAERIATGARTGKPSASAPELIVAAGMPAPVWQAIRRAIADAGGSLASVHCTHAAVLRDAAAHALAAHQDPLTVAVGIDEDGCAIAIAIDGQIALARTIDLGASALRRSYEHALRDAGHADTDPQAPPVAELADALLRAHGVPSRQESLPHGASADLVFQMMRPALQRLVFEVKQSIRFSATDAPGADDNARIRATVHTSLAGVPNLAGLLAKECDARLGPTPAETPNTPGARVLRAIAAARVPLALDAPVDAHATSAARSRWALGAGCLCALALVAADTVTTAARAERAARDADALEAAAEHTAAPDAQTLHLAAALRDTSTLLDHELGPVAPWAGAIAAASAVVPDGATLTRVSGERAADRSLLRLEGELAAPTAAAAHETLAAIVAALRTDPLFAAVDVPSIDQENRATGAVLTFAIRISLQEAPPAWVAEVTP